MTNAQPARVMAFVDGMNLFNSVKRSYGYQRPTFDPAALAGAVAAANGWNLVSTRFYVGMPEELVDPARHHFWRAKIRAMKGRGVFVESRLLRYELDPATRSLVLNGAGFPVGREKGIDLRLGLDMLEQAYSNAYDVALLFSQDQDFSEAIAAVKRFNPRLIVACAYPKESWQKPVTSATPAPFDRAMFDANQDTQNYRQMISLGEYEAVKMAGKLSGLSTFWGRATSHIASPGIEVAGMLRALFLIPGGDAHVCIDDGTTMHVATADRLIATTLRESLGRTVRLGTFYIDEAAVWCIRT